MAQTVSSQSPRRRLARLCGAVATAALLAGTAGAQSSAERTPRPGARDGGPTVVKGVTVTAVPRHKPTDTPPPLEAWAAPPRFSQIALSPDGSQVAFVTTIANIRLLITHSFADKSNRMVRLMGHGDVVQLGWADDDHLLAGSVGSTLRGTCDAGDQPAIQHGLMAQLAAMQSISSSLDPTDPSTIDVRSALTSLENTHYGHPCVYYGVRPTSAFVSIDMAHKQGHSLGLRFGDYTNRSIWALTPVTLKGKPWVEGPFLEVRSKPIGDEPAERAYLWAVDPNGIGRFIDDHGGDLERVEAYPDDWMVTSPDGEMVARALYDFTKGRFSIEMRTRGRWKPVLTREISPKAHTFAPAFVGLGRSEGSVIIMDAKDEPAPVGRAFHYYELTADGTATGPLEPDDAALDRPIFDPTTRRLAGFVQKGPEESYVLSEPSLQKLYEDALSSVPNETVKVVSTAADPRKMVIYASGGVDPGNYYFLDFSTGESRAIGEDYPQIPTDWVAEQSRITYRTADGLDIQAMLTLPPKPGPQKPPLVVLPHDGLETHDGRGFNWLAQALASRGYVVLQPNVRGSDGQGEDFIKAGWGQLGRKMQSDLTDGVRELVGRGLVDPKRVCIVGIGWGGYEAALAAETDSATFRCAASIDGVSDPAAYAGWLKKQLVLPEQDAITQLVNDPAAPRTYKLNPGSPGAVARYIGSQGPAPSAVAHAADAAVPVLVVYQNEDKQVPAGQGRELRDALRAHGKAVELVEVNGDDHDLTTHDTRLATVTAIVEFLAKQNPPG